MGINSSFWQDKKVFITGHTGFKGAWLSIWLHKLGAQVTGYALAPQTTPSLFELAQVKNFVQSNIGDISDYQKLYLSLESAKPEIVIHMAAQALVRYSYENPIETFQTNVMGTANLLQACRHISSVRAIVNVTTDKCYENKERLEGYKEHEPMGGYDPYSSSKGCSELVTAAYRRSFYDTKAKGLASARAGNVIGGGDWAQDRLLPDIFRSLFNKKTVIIRNPKSIRPWQHVLEPLSGYLTLAQKLYENPQKYSDAFNFGPHEQDARPVEYLAQKISEIWGADSHFEINNNYSGPHEAHYLKLDITKAREVLNWQPTWPLDTALEKTAEWFKDYENHADLLQSTYGQISKYEEEQSHL